MYAFKVHVQVLKFINKNLSGKMIFIKIAIFSKIMMEIFFGKECYHLQFCIKTNIIIVILVNFLKFQNTSCSTHRITSFSLHLIFLGSRSRSDSYITNVQILQVFD